MIGLSSRPSTKRNLTAVILCLTAAALMVVLLSLPLFHFQSVLFSKKSGNTFVGDERYIAASAEVTEAAAKYQAHQALGEVSITENVTERVNSKGETTSLVTFQVVLSSSRNGWQIMASSLPFGGILRCAMLLLVGALVLMGVSLSGGMLNESLRALPKWRKSLRGISCWMVLLSLALIPITAMNTIRVFEREIIFRLSTPEAAGLTELLRSADLFLYGGTAGEGVGDMLSGLTYSSTFALWAMIPVLFLILASMVTLCKGELKSTLASGALYLFVIALCVITLYPYYVMVITAFRENSEATDMYFTHMFPTKWIWSNLADITKRGVLGYLMNSLLLAGGATLIALVCGIPAAYAMARMRFAGKKGFLGFVIMSQMFAPVVLLVGISRLMNTLHLNDSLFGLMMVNAAFNQAFAIWLLRGTFVSISSEMEQAACIDGCNTVGALIHVLLPMSAPGIVTTLIFVFINAWNEYTISTVLISTPAKNPITVGITQFSSFNMIEWQYLFASSLLATIPVIIMFLFIEKHLVSGLTSGGVKG
ncbi:MAG: carbohydrate ABC transporter permease [Eubacteriales bacterium]|nr:carbohydrate ABC transporter permease [Eubacteriales bacterium]